MIQEGNLEVVDRVEAHDGAVVEIVQYPLLRGSADIRVARDLYYANQSGMRLKMVRIALADSRARVEPGALYFMKGNLQIKSSTGGGVLKGIARKMVSGETFFVPEIHGTGQIYLEPTFGHFFLHRIEEKERGVIVDKGLFYAGIGALDISAAAQKNISASLFGGEGMFQTRIAGSGVAVLYSPVPQEEVQRFTLRQEKLSVDGNFALMRSDTVDFRAERSGSMLTTATSGEGLLQTFTGTGYVWLAPTQGIYEKLTSPAGLRALAVPPGASHTQTDSST